MQAIIRQKLLPPIDCFKIEVSLESLYGTYCFYYLLSLGFEFYDKMFITCRSVNKDLLISMLYFANFP